MRGLLGIAAILVFAWALSEQRWRVPWRVVMAGVLLQFALALLFLKFPPAAAAFLLLNRAVEALQKATEAGTGFVFGYLGGGELPFAETRPGASFVFAFRALPMVLVISALAALLVPFRPDPSPAAQLVMADPPVSSMDAVAKGTRDGIVFLANIIAMLVVLVALVSLVNSVLGLLPDLAEEPVTLQRLFAYAFRPVMWLIGIPGPETAAAATLMGTKTVLNEFVAYVDFAKLPADALSERSRLIMTYALCGFANFGSLGILIGGMGAMVPERRPEIVALGLRSILSGTLATCMSGAVVGML